MKKFLFASILLSVFCCTNVHAASTDDIMNACYATRKCGAKGHIQTMTVIPFTAGGAVAGAVGGMGLGTLVPWAAGPGVGFVLGGAAGGYGGYLVGNQLGGYLAKSYNANEYLYFDDDTCLECDTYQMGEHYECPNGTIASNGSYFYRCRTETFGDSWEEYRPLPCRNSPIQDTSVKGAMYEIKATVDKRVNTGVYVYSGDMCLYITCGDGVLDKKTNSCVPKDNGGDDKKSECAEYISDFNLFQQCSFCNREKESGAFWDSKSKICRCIGEVNKDKEWNAEQGKCVAKVNDNDLQKCLNSRTTAEGRACCYLPESVAKFENGKCVCAGGKAFRIDMNGRGICTGGNNGEGQDIIPPATCMSLVDSLMTKVTTECASVLANVTVLSDMCTNGQLTWSYWNQQSLDINIKCEDDKARRGQEEVNKQAKQKLIAAGEKLDSIIAGFEKSRWKNAEGEFNTARLASDSIAGVVLGTTGGLVTSSVMKKKQVEQGFEDLQCVVGGQTVAGWGDEFVVGIQ